MTEQARGAAVASKNILQPLTLTSLYSNKRLMAEQEALQQHHFDAEHAGTLLSCNAQCSNLTSTCHGDELHLLLFPAKSRQLCCTH